MYIFIFRMLPFFDIQTFTYIKQTFRRSENIWDFKDYATWYCTTQRSCHYDAFFIYFFFIFPKLWLFNCWLQQSCSYMQNLVSKILYLNGQCKIMSYLTLLMDYKIKNNENNFKIIIQYLIITRKNAIILFPTILNEYII